MLVHDFQQSVLIPFAAKAKWRIKLEKAFSGARTDGGTMAGRWVLFILPLITVLREGPLSSRFYFIFSNKKNSTGMEAVIFIGGVALGQPATSIPIATIIGLICGLVVGFIIYSFASRTTLTVFLIVMTNLLLLIGAGLFSRAVWAFEANAFNKLLGMEVDDAGGDGPGSFRVQGSVWHLDCCNPEDPFDGSGWSVFNAIFGWTNSATRELSSPHSFTSAFLNLVHLIDLNFSRLGPLIRILLDRGHRHARRHEISRGPLEGVWDGVRGGDPEANGARDQGTGAGGAAGGDGGGEVGFERQQK
jgi:FTR1 family protein